MSEKICLKNSDGKVVRILPLQDAGTIVIARSPEDSRLMFRSPKDVETLQTEGWEIIKEVQYAQVVNGDLPLTPGLSLAKYDPAIKVAHQSYQENEESDSTIKRSILFSIVLGILFCAMVFNAPQPLPVEVQEEKRQTVVKIIQKQKAEVVKLQRTQTNINVQNNTKVTPTKNTQSIKRMGALAALGSLSNSKQQGGLDLGATVKSAGPGLGGGTGGSGGVQTSLYGKGIVSAPLGVGGNLNGAGGYGTKGKGGGQAGYGKLSLVGSAGTLDIPVGTEVISGGGGLSNDDIWAVIRRNQGQIRFCYEQGLQSDPKLKGVVHAAWTINGNGQVTGLSIANTTLNSKMVEDCISLRIKSWKFPLPQGGQAISVKIPFNLSKQGQG